jgi:DNA-binding transcriptional MerR regulator
VSEYRIDDLARAAGTTVRNVRAYQDKGLLPTPRKEGRVAYYDEAHLARLRVIGALLDRGYSLGNIAELMATWEAGGDLRELLGFEQAVMSPFNDEAESTIAVDELARMFGTIDPLAIAKAVKLGLLIPGETTFRVPSMRLLRAGVELHRAGIPLVPLIEELGRLRDDVDRIAERFVALVQKHVFDQYGDALPPQAEAGKLADMVRRVRPLAELVVDTELARALEKHIRAGLGDRLSRLLERKKRKR